MSLIFKQLLQAICLGALLPALIFSTVSGGTARYVPLSQSPESGPEIELLHKEGDVEKIALEDYVVGVVLGEISTGFREEAIKAQAVAARTYTLYCLETASKHEQGEVCTDSQCCQAYRDPEEYLKLGGTSSGLQKVQKAVSETAAEVLYHEGSLICATYFASSGGRTEDAQEVWGRSYPYLQPVDSPGEEACGYFSQETTYTPGELQELLDVRLTGKPPSWFGMVTYTPGGGVDLIRIGGRIYTGVELRKKLGLRSTAFRVVPTDEVIIIETVGYGHRVGLSQHGANAMAKNGSDYTEILAHYYAETTLQQYASME